MAQLARLPLALPDLEISASPKIAILRALYLGDLLCATPAFRALRERFPKAEITLIGLPWSAEFVARSPHLDRFLPFPGWPGLEDEPPDPAGPGPFLAAARAARFDLALQMHGSGGTSNDCVAALGARVTFGYRQGDEDRCLDWSIPHRQDDHETLRWLRLVALLGARTPERRPIFPLTPGEVASAAALLESHPARTGRRRRRLVGIHVGAKDPARRWPAKRFAALADLLWARDGVALVLTGGAKERPVADGVLRELHAPVLDLVGRTDLGTFAAVIAQLDLLVTNDTGSSHLAAASRTPSIVLFGPSRPGQWAPIDRTLHRALDARSLVPCYHDGARALRHLPVEVVRAACAEQLQAGKSQGAGLSTPHPHRQDQQPANLALGTAED